MFNNVENNMAQVMKQANFCAVTVGEVESTASAGTVPGEFQPVTHVCTFHCG